MVPEVIASATKTIFSATEKEGGSASVRGLIIVVKSLQRYRMKEGIVAPERGMGSQEDSYLFVSLFNSHDPIFWGWRLAVN